MVCLMTSRATSKAAFREEKENGNIMSQEDKILDIISSTGGLWSMQEILAAYRVKWGKIELSSVSARINKLKTDLKVVEGPPRKCSITDKTINPLTIEREKGLGEYNAWVASGKDKAEQHARFKQVPQHMKQQVVNHMETVKALGGGK